MLRAANWSGKAINISQTTAAHAMSYKITSLYGLAHGHAVAVCLPWVWEYMLLHLEKTADGRGEEYVRQIFDELSQMFRVNSADEAIKKILDWYGEIGIKYEHIVRSVDIDTLAEAVNLERLKNNPVRLDKGAIRWVYGRLV